MSKNVGIFQCKRGDQKAVQDNCVCVCGRITTLVNSPNQSRRRKKKMAFKLDSVVPWGRNMEEYKLMFQLNDEDVSKKIVGFGDGPACFNYEMTKRNKQKY